MCWPGRDWHLLMIFRNTDIIHHMQVRRLCGKVGGKPTQSINKSIKINQAINQSNNAIYPCYFLLLKWRSNWLYTLCCPCGISPILVLLSNFKWLLMDFTLCVVLVECHILELSTILVHKGVIVWCHMYITSAQEIMVLL